MSKVLWNTTRGRVISDYEIRNLNPGGFLEVLDICFDIGCDDNTLPEDSAFRKWVELMLEASVNLGSSLLSIKSIKSHMKDVGFVDVKVTAGCWPINWWAKDPRYKKIGTIYPRTMGGHASNPSSELTC